MSGWIAPLRSAWQRPAGSVIKLFRLHQQPRLGRTFQVGLDIPHSSHEIRRPSPRSLKKRRPDLTAAVLPAAVLPAAAAALLAEFLHGGHSDGGLGGLGAGNASGACRGRFSSWPPSGRLPRQQGRVSHSARQETHTCRGAGVGDTPFSGGPNTWIRPCCTGRWRLPASGTRPLGHLE